jgi:hypothetical protein
MNTRKPDRQVLHTYLNDHLAGATGALQMLDGMIEDPDHGGERGEIAQWRAEIAEDRDTLERIITSVGGQTSVLRQAGGRMAEWAERLKLLLDERGHGTLGRLERFETLALGILGKLSLWRALAAARIPELQAVDFDRLAVRAEDQYRRVERRRIESAQRVLTQ